VCVGQQGLERVVWFRRVPRIGVLFVCMGNICRSPTAEAVLRHHARLAGLEKRLRIDSAGTHAGWPGAPPDPRAVTAARRRNYDLRGIRARRVETVDFSRHHYVLAMDAGNLKALEVAQPEGHGARLGLLLEFAPQLAEREIPDPYYGGPEGFERVLDLTEAAVQGLLAELRGRL
jgi:protein-tyrosine phosphatase